MSLTAARLAAASLSPMPPVPTVDAPRVEPDARDGAVAASRRSELVARWLPLACLTLFLLLMIAWVTSYAWDNAKYTTLDELWAVIGGRLMERDLFLQLTDTGHFNRGPERLASLIMALPFTLFDSSADDLRGARLLISTAWFLAAFPLYALGRGLGLTRWAAVLIAAAGVVGPWIVFPTTMLNTALAFPLTVTFAWAAWRTAVRPSVLGDLLVIVLAGVNTLARTSDATFAVVAAIAVVYAVWHRRPREDGLGRNLLRLPLRIARTHPLLTVAGVAAVLIVVVVGPERFVGQAYAITDTADFEFPVDFIWEHLTQWFAQTTLALAFVPVVVGGAWALREVVRPHTTEGGVFAIVMLSIFLVFVYVTGSQNSQIEERYVAVVGGLPVVAFGVVIFRRQPWVLGTLLLGLLAARAIATKAAYVDATPFSYLVAPARLAYQQVVLGRTSTVVPESTADTVMTLAMVALAVGVAVAFSPWLHERVGAIGRRPYAAGLVTAAALLGVLLVMSAYTLRKYEPATFPGTSLEQMAWIDEATGGTAVDGLGLRERRGGHRQALPVVAGDVLQRLGVLLRGLQRAARPDRPRGPAAAVRRRVGVHREVRRLSPGRLRERGRRPLGGVGRGDARRALRRRAGRRLQGHRRRAARRGGPRADGEVPALPAGP